MKKRHQLFDIDGNVIETTLVEINMPAEALLAQYRYEQENKGIVIGGVKIQTARESRANILGSRTKAKENAAYTVMWKASSGWAELNAVQIIAAADAVEEHVQKCFRAEAAVFDYLDEIDTMDDMIEAFQAEYDAL